MRSAFFEYNVATSALFTARGGLDTTSHNVANASTKGYSRQIVEQRASMPLYLNTGKGMIGTGSEIYGITQIRDFYLDKKYWANVSTLGEYSTKAVQSDLTQSILNEMSGTGLKSQFDTFFDRIQDLTTNAGDTTYRTNLSQLGDAITTFFDNTYSAFQKQQRDINEEIKAVVTIINSTAQQISSLNKQISKFELSGSKANDLRDQRARLVDELSKYVNVDVREVERNDDYAQGKYPESENRGKSDKQFIVMLNGKELVNHFEINTLELKERKVSVGANTYNTNYNPEDVSGLYDIAWSGTGTLFNIYNPSLKGELKGLIDMRDGNNGKVARPQGPPSFDPTTGQLVMDMDPNNTRVDLNPNGGVISVLDSATGQTREYAYGAYSYDLTTKKGTFTIISPAPSTLPSTHFDNTAGPPASTKTFSVGETTNYKGIPYYMSRLNDMARTIALAMNEGKYQNGQNIPDVIGHVNGFNLNGENLKTLFFTYEDSTGQQIKDLANFNVHAITAANFRINEDLLLHPELMAASDTATGGVDNNKVISSFLKIKSDRKLFREGTLEAYITGVTGELGIDLKQSKNFAASYTDLSTNVDNQRMSISGVDINEEMVNMIKYQQLYQAAAKLMNVIDSIYDTTVNRLGSF